MSKLSLPDLPEASVVSESTYVSGMAAARDGTHACPDTPSSLSEEVPQLILSFVANAANVSRMVQHSRLQVATRIPMGSWHKAPQSSQMG